MSTKTFLFNDTATHDIYTLSLHDALPISIAPTAISPGPTKPIIAKIRQNSGRDSLFGRSRKCRFNWADIARSEEHTSELQSHVNLVCRLLLEKKKYKIE